MGYRKKYIEEKDRGNIIVFIPIFKQKNVDFIMYRYDLLIL